MKKITLIMCLFPFLAFAQNQEIESIEPTDTLPDNVFNLGEVTIISSRIKMTNRVTQKEMEGQNKLDVAQALNMLPGISASNAGARNESMINVRGFDLRAVPIYMDGIPVYVPYDGYVDLARFTTLDLAAIDVSKGFSSLLYGPNSLGGAVNLISRKPTQKLEYDGALGIINTNGFRGNVNIGSNLGKFYLQAGYSYLHRNSFTMSRHFIPNKLEDGGERDNSLRTDQKVNIKLGWTPTKNQEYVIGYMYQNGQKGNPSYAGKDPQNMLATKPRYWKWPYWNKEMIYFLSNTKIGEKNAIKSRVYYDAFRNAVHSYDDATFTTQNKPSSFQSMYNDFTVGGNLDYETHLIPKNKLTFSTQYKGDVHRENNLNEPVRTFVDNTINFVLEDIYTINPKVRLVPGIGYSIRKNERAEDYDSKKNSIMPFTAAKSKGALNGQIGLFYQFITNQHINFTAAYKTRFSTIKDRYSYKMGTAIPNPELKPESSINFDLTYQGVFFKKLAVQSSLFYSRITDAIINVSNVIPGKSQMQNTGLAQFMGVELAVNYQILENLKIHSNYTYIERKNITNPKILFTDVPYTKVYSFVQYNPIKQLGILFSVEYNSLRYSTSYGTKAPDFTIANLMISGRVSSFLRIELGVNNLFDRNYMLSEGYPEEGRNFLVTLRFNNPDSYLKKKDK